jgi:hypothetical protein
MQVFLTRSLVSRRRADNRRNTSRFKLCQDRFTV